MAREYDAAYRELGAVRRESSLSGEAWSGRAVALVANNYAWACYMLDDAALLDEADLASAEAHQKLPNHASVLGTRGAVLVARGRVAEGKPLLKRAVKLHRMRALKATNLVCLALAALRQGQRKTARRFLADAKKLDPDCDLLSRGQRELDVADQRRGEREATYSAASDQPR